MEILSSIWILIFFCVSLMGFLFQEALHYLIHHLHVDEHQIHFEDYMVDYSTMGDQMLQELTIVFILLKATYRRSF